MRDAGSHPHPPSLPRRGRGRPCDPPVPPSIPFARVEAVDLDRYVVGKSLDGLFLVLAEQERQIRTDPAARTTSLLKQVFGR